MRHLICSLVMFFCFTSLFAQNPKFQTGQILLHNGEKKIGLVANLFFRGDSKGVFFKIEENSKEEYVDIENIEEVYFDEYNIFKSYCFRNQNQEYCIWLQILIKGQANLYRSNTNYNLYFFEENGVTTQIDYKTLPGLVTLLKKNCEGFSSKPNPKLDIRSMIELVRAYNECKNGNSQNKVYYKSTSPTLFFGPKLGIDIGNASILKNPYFRIDEYIGAPSPTFGLSLKIETNSNWSLYSELGYLKRSITNDSFNFGDNILLNYAKLKVKLTYIELPLTVQYRFSRNKISPFLQTGIHVLFPLNREFYGISFSDPSGSRIEPSLNRFLGLGVGYSLGCGIDGKVSSKMSFQAIAQYTYYINEYENSLAIYPERVMNFNFPCLRLGATLFWKI